MRRLFFSTYLMAALIGFGACNTDDLNPVEENLREEEPSGSRRDAGDDPPGEDASPGIGSDDDAGRDSGGGDSGGGASGGDDAGDADSGGGTPPDPIEGCQGIADTTARFELAGEEGAYYGRAIKAGDEIWVSYIGVVNQGGERVEKTFLARFGCDGQPINAPERVGASSTVREMSPVIAGDDETVYIVWVSETGQGQEVYGRTFKLDGTPRQNEPFRVIISLKGGESVGTIWKPDIAVMDDGSAVLIFEGLTMVNPRALLQRIDKEGANIGNGMYAYAADAHGGQQDPAITVLEDGTVQFAYLGGESNAGRVYQGWISPGELDPAGDPVAAQSQSSASHSVRYSKARVDGASWMTYPLGINGTNDVVLRNAMPAGPTTVKTTSAGSGRINIHSSVAASDTGGALAWLSYTSSPSKSRVHIQRFKTGADGAVASFGTRVNEHSADVAAWPYGPDIIWLYDDVYAVFWSERDGNMSIRGRILELP